MYRRKRYDQHITFEDCNVYYNFIQTEIHPFLIAMATICRPNTPQVCLMDQVKVYRNFERVPNS